MENDPEFLTLPVGGIPLRIPVYIDAATTQAIVDDVNAMLKQIEQESARVDTQRFALLAAVHFATEVRRVQQDAEVEIKTKDSATGAEIAEVLAELSRLVDAVRETLEEAEEAEG